jgi:hypothetical protein
VPDDFSVEAVIAIGKQADATLLPPELQQREAPNDRIPLKEIVREGGFPNVTQPLININSQTTATRAFGG